MSSSLKTVPMKHLPVDRQKKKQYLRYLKDVAIAVCSQVARCATSSL